MARQTLHRWALWLLLLGSGAVYAVNLSGRLREGFLRLRLAGHLRPDRMVYGDLYALCYLPAFRAPRPQYAPKPPAAQTSPKKTVLYVLGDSYLANKLSDSLFVGVSGLHFYRHEHALPTLRLDTLQQNYVMIEVAERKLKPYLLDTALLERLRRWPEKPLPLAQHWGQKAWNRLWQPHAFDYMNRTLETTLWDYSLWRPLKEAKVWVGHKWLKRMPPHVHVHGHQLYYNATVYPDNPLSSFRPVANAELDSMVAQLNRLHRTLLGLGFARVYLSVVPNTATVLPPLSQPYNGLIPRLHAHPHLQMEWIDAYTPLMRAGRAAFAPHDTHWNNHGLQLWLNQANGKLEEALHAVP